MRLTPTTLSGVLLGTALLGMGAVGCGPSAPNVDGGPLVDAPDAETLSVILGGNGTGRVTSDPAGIDCGTQCMADFLPETVVTLTATPEAGSYFMGWSGACTGMGDCVVTLDGARAVSATFTVDTQSLSVSTAGTGSGTVTSDPSGIACPVDCTESFPTNAMVTLTATPAAASRFAGWSGACTGVGDCVVDVSGAVFVVATFTATAELTVTRSGMGSGTVTSMPAGIDCGSTCAATFDAGTLVELIATPASGSALTAWSGACSGTGTCIVPLAASSSVGAQFSPVLVCATPGTWTCASGVSCQDVYDITLLGGTTVTIAVSSVSGSSVVRLAAFAPGVALSGANQLTGPTSDRLCGGRDASDTVTFRARMDGRYRFAVGRDSPLSIGNNGAYQLTVTSSRPLQFEGQTANDAPSTASGTRCGYSYSATGAWSCGATSCQDVYDFDLFTATPLIVAVSGVTGGSVVRLAVFDGSALDGTNRLNGGLTDRECVGQNAPDMATSPSLSVGHHRVAIGRDLGSSAGSSGMYTVTITTPNAPLVPNGATADDIRSSFATTTCP